MVKTPAPSSQRAPVNSRRRERSEPAILAKTIFKPHMQRQPAFLLGQDTPARKVDIEKSSTEDWGIDRLSIGSNLRKLTFAARRRLLPQSLRNEADAAWAAWRNGLWSYRLYWETLREKSLRRAFQELVAIDGIWSGDVSLPGDFPACNFSMPPPLLVILWALRKPAVKSLTVRATRSSAASYACFSRREHRRLTTILLSPMQFSTSKRRAPKRIWSGYSSRRRSDPLMAMIANHG